MFQSVSSAAPHCTASPLREEPPQFRLLQNPQHPANHQVKGHSVFNSISIKGWSKQGNVQSCSNCREGNHWWSVWITSVLKNSQESDYKLSRWSRNVSAKVTQSWELKATPRKGISRGRVLQTGVPIWDPWWLCPRWMAASWWETASHSPGKWAFSGVVERKHNDVEHLPC